MQDLKSLKNDLTKIKNDVEQAVVNVQQEVAELIETDARNLAPGSGPYSETIKVRPTQIKAKNISTSVSTKLMTPVAKSTGKQYNLGFLLETGTNPHAIPNAFNWGVIYGYDSFMYKRTLAKDWHPGFVSMPHFIPALEMNTAIYEERLGKALDGLFK